MRLSMPVVAITVAILGLAMAAPATAAPFFFSTGEPDAKMGTASRPAAGSPFEIESADDFDLTQATAISSATFTGLIPTGSSVLDVVVEIYQVFPALSDVTRTSGPPTFSTPKVPTRVNSPSDVELDSRDSASNTLTFTTTDLGPFTVNNTVRPGGINSKPGQATGGDGSFTGDEVQFGVTFTAAFTLPADHYFFVPQVELDKGDFLWLSAPRPIVASGTPFPPGVTDLQSWTRDAMLDPDWLRVGTDIVDTIFTTTAPTFNETFSLSGETIPEPASLVLLGTAIAGLFGLRRRGV